VLIVTGCFLSRFHHKEIGSLLEMVTKCYGFGMWRQELAFIHWLAITTGLNVLDFLKVMWLLLPAAMGQ
jgi:hypothetical protein